eukprot:6205121-Pleurochrysis_carterae.AAC.4
MATAAAASLRSQRRQRQRHSRPDFSALQLLVLTLNGVAAMVGANSFAKLALVCPSTGGCSTCGSTRAESFMTRRASPIHDTRLRHAPKLALDDVPTVYWQQKREALILERDRRVRELEELCEREKVFLASISHLNRGSGTATQIHPNDVTLPSGDARLPKRAPFATTEQQEDQAALCEAAELKEALERSERALAELARQRELDVQRTGNFWLARVGSLQEQLRQVEKAAAEAEARATAAADAEVQAKPAATPEADGGAVNGDARAKELLELERGVDDLL